MPCRACGHPGPSVSTMHELACNGWCLLRKCIQEVLFVYVSLLNSASYASHACAHVPASHVFSLRFSFLSGASCLFELFQKSPQWQGNDGYDPVKTLCPSG
jgi:hypothetical protein